CMPLDRHKKPLRRDPLMPSSCFPPSLEKSYRFFFRRETREKVEVIQNWVMKSRAATSRLFASCIARLSSCPIAMRYVQDISGQADHYGFLGIADGVVGGELERLARQERLFPGDHAALFFPVGELGLRLEGRIDADLVGYCHRRGFEQQELDRHFVPAGDNVEVGDLPLVALADEAARAAPVLGAAGAHLDAVVATEGEHELLLRLRVPEGRADIASVAVE